MRRRLCALRTLVSSVVLLAARESAAVVALTAADVERIIGQAVAEAKVLQHPVTVAVVDHEGNPKRPLGLSGDAGALPLYKHGRAVGGVGVEGDGKYTADFNPRDDDLSFEERIAAAGTRGFEAPRAIRADQILVGGLRFPFANTDDTSGPSPPSFANLSAGATCTGDAACVEVAPSDAPPSQFRPQRLGGVAGTVDDRFFPPRGSMDPPPEEGGLTADEVSGMLARGASRANRLRAAIRRPFGDHARVNIAVVDRDGNVLGLF